MVDSPTPTTDYSETLAESMAAIKAGMDALLDWSRAHPHIRLFQSGETWGIARSNELDTIDIVRAIKDGAPIGMVRKETGIGHLGDEQMFIRRDFGGGVELFHIAERDEVCTARVVGTETVEIPDPEAPLVTVERDVIVWDCHPVLAETSAA